MKLPGPSAEPCGSSEQLNRQTDKQDIHAHHSRESLVSSLGWEQGANTLATHTWATVSLYSVRCTCIAHTRSQGTHSGRASRQLDPHTPHILWGKDSAVKTCKGI